MNVLGSLEKIMNATEDVLEEVPINPSTKRGILKFFGDKNGNGGSELSSSASPFVEQMMDRRNNGTAMDVHEKSMNMDAEVLPDNGEYNRVTMNQLQNPNYIPHHQQDYQQQQQQMMEYTHNTNNTNNNINTINNNNTTTTNNNNNNNNGHHNQFSAFSSQKSMPRQQHHNTHNNNNQFWIPKPTSTPTPTPTQANRANDYEQRYMGNKSSYYCQDPPMTQFRYDNEECTSTNHKPIYNNNTKSQNFSTSFTQSRRVMVPSMSSSPQQQQHQQHQQHQQQQQRSNLSHSSAMYQYNNQFNSDNNNGLLPSSSESFMPFHQRNLMVQHTYPQQAFYQQNIPPPRYHMIDNHELQYMNIPFENNEKVNHNTTRQTYSDGNHTISSHNRNNFDGFHYH